MKVAPIVTQGGTKETGEILLIVTVEESEMIVAGLYALKAIRKRSGKLRKLIVESENMPVV